MRRARTTLLPAEWPEPDRRRWEAANAKGRCLRADGRAARWKPKTRRGVEKRYGLWLGYLKSAEILVNDDRPSKRTSKQNLEGYVVYLQDRGNASATIHLLHPRCPRGHSCHGAGGRSHLVEPCCWPR